VTKASTTENTKGQTLQNKTGNKENKKQEINQKDTKNMTFFCLFGCF